MLARGHLVLGSLLSAFLLGTEAGMIAREGDADAAEGVVHLLDKAHDRELLEVVLGDLKEALVDEEEIVPLVSQQGFGHDVVPPGHGKVGGEIHAWAVVTRVREG